jgi:acyl-CoA synthetase (AMP-forming)/AMP-acid ligase II
MHPSELAARQPDKPAVIMADGSAMVTFAELDREVARYRSGCRDEAIVQAAGGEAMPDELAATLLAHCRSRLASYKCPRSIEFTASQPVYREGFYGCEGSPTLQHGKFYIIGEIYMKPCDG